MTELTTAGASLFEPREGDLTIGWAGRKGNRVVAVFERVPDVGDDGFELVSSPLGNSLPACRFCGCLSRVVAETA